MVQEVEQVLNFHYIIKSEFFYDLRNLGRI